MAAIKIIATPDPSVEEMSAEGLGRDFGRAHAAATGAGYTHVAGYRTLADLEAKVAQALGTSDCLAVLEIYAHGNPTLNDGINMTNAAKVGAWLKTLRLCDRVDVYLTGCNTGVNNSSDSSGRPIAQLVSAAGPTESANHVRCYVWGTVGYTSGTYMEDNTACTVRCTTGKGKKKHYFAPYPASADGKHLGSQAATGRAHCYRSFKEGVAQ